MNTILNLYIRKEIWKFGKHPGKFRNLEIFGRNLGFWKPTGKIYKIWRFLSPMKILYSEQKFDYPHAKKPLDERLNSKQTKGTKFLLKSGSLDKLSFHNLFQYNCFIIFLNCFVLIYFRKPYKIHQNV